MHCGQTDVRPGSIPFGILFSALLAHDILEESGVMFYTRNNRGLFNLSRLRAKNKKGRVHVREFSPPMTLPWSLALLSTCKICAIVLLRAALSGVGGGGAEGASSPPKVLMC